MLNEKQLKQFKRHFNQNDSFLREVAKSTTYSKKRIRIAKEILINKD
jgi:hypothetical protein